MSFWSLDLTSRLGRTYKPRSTAKFTLNMGRRSQDMGIFGVIRQFLRRSWRPTLSLAIAYSLVGWLSGYLAIPPGYASPVWPAAGVALLGVLYWQRRAYLGIWLGSFAINVLIGVKAAGYPTFASVTVAGAIAIGAVLQAWFGNVLLRKLFQHSIWKAEILGILALLVLAGPVSCLVGATVGNSILVASRSIALANVPESWWNWWIGDALGILAILPIGTIYLLKRRRIPLELQADTDQSHRLLSYILPVFLVLTSTIAIFIATQNSEKQRLLNIFQSDTQIITQRLQENLDRASSVLFSLQNFLNTVDVNNQPVPITRSQFKTFTESYFQQLTGVQALGWIPLVQGSDRAFYETYAQKEGLTGFQFTQKTPEGVLARDRERDTYYPVFYIEPIASNAKALGFNLGSEERRLQTLLRTRDSGKMMATPPIKLVQKAGHQWDVITYLPLYKSGVLETPDSRKAMLKGYVSAVFKMEDLLGSSLQELIPPGISLQLRDRPLGELLYQSSATKVHYRSSIRENIFFGSRTWEIHFLGEEVYFQRLRTNESAVVLLAGFFITGLTGAFSIAQIRNSITVNLLVDRRTAELAKSREEALAAARTAEKANRAKSNFLAIMSHELRTPLNSVLGFTECLKEEMFGPVNAEQKQALVTVESNGRHLLALITDILDLSKIEEGRFQLDYTQADLELLCNLSVSAVQPQAAAKKIAITIELPPNLGKVSIDERRIQQALINLLSNAVKFTPNGGQITLRVSPPDLETGFIQLAVIDTGIGISAEDFTRLFQPFTQLDEALNRQYEGTGLGLSLVKRLVELHGGRVGVTSEVGVGSSFTIDLPCHPLPRGMSSPSFAMSPESPSH